MLSLQLARRLPPACSRRTLATAIGARPPLEQDITIIGGGPAGLSLLASLARSPVTAHLRTTLVEAGDLAKVEHWSETEGVWTNRVSSVTNDNRRFLEGSFRHARNASPAIACSRRHRADWWYHLFSTSWQRSAAGSTSMQQGQARLRRCRSVQLPRSARGSLVSRGSDQAHPLMSSTSNPSLGLGHGVHVAAATDTHVAIGLGHVDPPREPQPSAVAPPAPL